MLQNHVDQNVRHANMKMTCLPLSVLKAKLFGKDKNLFTSIEFEEKKNLWKFDDEKKAVNNWHFCHFTNRIIGQTCWLKTDWIETKERKILGWEKKWRIRLKEDISEWFWQNTGFLFGSFGENKKRSIPNCISITLIGNDPSNIR